MDENIRESDSNKFMDIAAKAIYAVNKRNGWWEDRTRGMADLPEIIALCHSELSEALEAYRNHEGNARIIEELADTIIRILDAAVGLQLPSIHRAIMDKVSKNAKRGYKHGGKEC